MCGILGVMRFDGRAVDHDQLVAMRDTMLHRGPDEAGVHLDGPVGLAARRLSIFDLSPKGRQPLTNEDRTLWMIFNGAIYNYVELGADLLQRGHTLRSDSDGEVILHLYEDLGEACVHRLNGMFAFVIWDSRRQRLFGACDRMGIKSLNYYCGADQFICASEVKAILEDASVGRAADNQAIADFFFAGASLGDRTSFKGVKRLLPGHTINVDVSGTVRVDQYWDIAFAYNHGRSDSKVTHELHDLLDDAVRIHCRSDVPIGCHVSGGLDSSTVAGFARRHRPSAKSFTVRFGAGGYYDESEFAKQMAN